jgi:hypothetical protein
MWWRIWNELAFWFTFETKARQKERVEESCLVGVFGVVAFIFLWECASNFSFLQRVYHPFVETVLVAKKQSNRMKLSHRIRDLLLSFLLSTEMSEYLPPNISFGFIYNPVVDQTTF